VREKVVVYKENERVNGSGRRKREIACDRMRIVSKEALVLIKLAPVFFSFFVLFFSTAV
jgi:hypothetical protein